MSPAPSAEDDAATIARAQELLRTDPDKYWSDAELQEAQLEALEREGAASSAPADPAAPPSPTAAAWPLLRPWLRTATLTSAGTTRSCP